jgi:hypothetical protein
MYPMIFDLPDGITDIKEVKEITEEFAKNKSLDYLGEGLTTVAEKLKVPQNIVWMKWAEELNRKQYGEEGYMCEKKKTGKADCFNCNFYNIRDKLTLEGICIENSSVSPIRRLTDASYKPPQYSPIKRIVIELPNGRFLTSKTDI